MVRLLISLKLKSEFLMLNGELYLRVLFFLLASDKCNGLMVWVQSTAHVPVCLIKGRLNVLVI